MKNQSLLSFFLKYFLFSLIIFSGIISCSDNKITNGSNVTITGVLNLPFDANGKTWVVLIDDDLSGDNGYVQMGTGTCGTGKNISYSVTNIPQGTYYVYSAIFVVSDGSQGPQIGDLFGIYGGHLPYNIPSSPNANISSSNQNFDIDLYVWQANLPSNTIVAHWAFEEMSGNTLNDYGIYNNHGAIVNAQWVNGYAGGALQFQDDCYVNVPYSSSLQPSENITLEAIVKFTTFSQNQAILSTNEYGGYGLWVHDTQVNIFIGINSEYLSALASSDELNFNQWYHIAGVYNGSEVKIYIDGNLKESIATTGPITYTYQNALKIGSDASSTGAPDNCFFQGKIDEIRITNVALQPAQFLYF